MMRKATAQRAHRPAHARAWFVVLGVLLACSAGHAGDGPSVHISSSLLEAVRQGAKGACAMSLADVEPDALPEGLGRFAARTPIDTAYQFGTSALYCPHYLPDLYPGKNLDELCGDDLLTSPWLLQKGLVNPFAVAKEEFELLADSARERERRLPWLAAYAYIHRDCEEWATDTALAGLAARNTLIDEVAVDALAPEAIELLPDALTQVRAPEGHIPIDIRAFSQVSYDSVASVERVLVKAAQRGIKAICIADRSRIEGWQKAERIVAKLKRRGRLPEEFLIIPGQMVSSHSGSVLSLFTRSIIPDFMTMERTICCIHREGGLAYMVHPGVPGGPARLANLEFDGFLIQPNMFEMFRTLCLINDPQYADKPGLTASNSQYSGTVGLPYVVVEAHELTLEALREGMKRRRVYAAGELYLPWMTVASFPPTAKTARFFGRYFDLHGYAEQSITRLIGADSIIVSTSWDNEVRAIIGLTGMPAGLWDILRGDSPLTDWPRLGRVAAEYSFVRVGYDNPSDTAFIQATITW